MLAAFLKMALTKFRFSPLINNLSYKTSFYQYFLTFMKRNDFVFGLQLDNAEKHSVNNFKSAATPSLTTV